MLEQYWDFMHSPVVTRQQSFVENQKPFCWKKFLAANKSMLEGLHALREDENLPGNRIINDTEKFVVSLYSTIDKTNVYSLSQLRWYLFCKHQYTDDMLPPMAGALKLGVILCPWCGNAHVPKQDRIFLHLLIMAGWKLMEN